MYAQLLSCSVTSDSLWPHGLWPSRFLCPWDFPARIQEWVAISSSGDLPNLGTEPASPALAGGFFTTEPAGKPQRGSKESKEK